MGRQSNGGVCSGCRGLRDRAGQRYCKSCHAASMRRNRPKHRDMADHARKKANARAYVNVYVRRGVLKRQELCEVAGCQGKSEMHHPDYSKPLEVRWFCRPHHLEHHRSVEQAGSADQPLDSVG